MSDEKQWKEIARSAPSPEGFVLRIEQEVEAADLPEDPSFNVCISCE